MSLDRPTEPSGTDEPLVIVSCDSHIGPRVRDDLRPYCPSSHLAEFDAFLAELEAQRAALYAKLQGRAQAAVGRNRRTDGHFDMTARRADLDHEGVAAEIIFHGSQNEEPIPFGNFVVFLPTDAYPPGLVGLGRHIYNQWLADACATDPVRHIGLAQLPMWDVDAAVAELTWARDAGLRGVNFPAPGPGLVAYNNPVWEPFWSACEDLGMTLTTHSGAGSPDSWTGPEAMALVSLESGGWMSRRALHQMIFGGVFERHPKLRLVLTEQPGTWWSSTLREYDSVFHTFKGGLRRQMSKLPSEYCREHVAIGGSFLAPFEAADAVADGYVPNVLWGSDYPHTEGTWQFPLEGDEVESFGLAALQHTFAGIAPEHTRAMVGENAIRFYGLDAEALTEVARRIGAPTARDLATPLEKIPAGAGMLAFRTFGAWS